MPALVAAWDMNTATNRMLLDPLSEDDLQSRYAPRTRSAASQFAHIHNIRIAQLDKRAASKPEGLKSFPRGAEPTKAELEFFAHVAGEHETQRCQQSGGPDPLAGIELAGGECDGNAERQISIAVQHRIEPGASRTPEELEARDFAVTAV